jgi:hypothetical protein
LHNPTFSLLPPTLRGSSSNEKGEQKAGTKMFPALGFRD